MHALLPPQAAGRLGLIRPRLLEVLGATRTAPLALVISPAGSGKTTLLAQYAAAWAGPVGWWQIGTANTTATDVLHAIGRFALGLAATQVPTDAQELLEIFRTARRAHTLMVIDDLHLLSGTEVWTALETSVAHSPAWLHILGAGRRMPDFNLSRFELADTCLVDAEQLRFRSWEVEDLLRDVYHEPLPPDDTAMLTRRVGGWAAGLHLFHLSTRGQPLAQRRCAVAALDGRSTLTRAYLARTVLDELPSGLRDFLVRTCVFEVVTPERCESLLGHPGVSRRHLQDLERRRAFTSSPDGGHSYRYHEVLRAHLIARLAEDTGDAAAREWHARAAALLVAEGALTEAVQAYARAEEWARVRELLRKLGTRVADEDVEPWRDLLPGWLVAEDPSLMLAEGRHLLGRGQMAAAVRQLRSAEERFSDERSRARCRATRRIAATWLPGQAAPAEHYSAALREATRRYPQRVASAARGQPFVQVAGYLLAGNVAQAHEVLEAGTVTGTDAAGLGTLLLQACWALASGSPDGGQRLGDVVAGAERARLPWLVRMARAAQALDGSPRGAEDARAVLRECDREDDRWGGMLAQAALCLIRSVAATADATDVREATELLRRCQALDAAVLEAWAQALVSVAAAAAGMPAADLEAQRAESLARSAGVPGARVAALAAATRQAGAAADPRALAGQCGLPPAVVARWMAASSRERLLVTEPVPVEVRCFGGFRMWLRDRPLDLSAVKPRTRMALRLLAMHAGRPVHRETMIEALWRDLTPAAATRNLHVTLSSLRTFLEPGSPRGHSGLVARTGDAYRLALPEGGYSDVADFEAALAEARCARLRGDDRAGTDPLRRAVLAYTGDLLPEDGPEEWVVHKRDSLRHQAAESAARLAALALADGRAEEAITAAERCVEIDRYCDAGWRVLADSFDLMHNPAAAARARRDYAKVLESLGAGQVRELPVRCARDGPASAHSPPMAAGAAIPSLSPRRSR